MPGANTDEMMLVLRGEKQSNTKVLNITLKERYTLERMKVRDISDCEEWDFTHLIT